MGKHFMPSVLIPHKSPAHRVAAIALYRALLTQTAALQLPEPQAEALTTLIRNRFKQVQHLGSPNRLRFSFLAGYEALDHLDAAVANDTTSRSYLLSLLDRVPSQIKSTPWKSSQHRRNEARAAYGAARRAEAEQSRQATAAGERIALFDRPLPLDRLTGARHVPVMVDANRIPVLRLKKPQPMSLSRYIRGRVDARQQRDNTRHRLELEADVAAGEDLWDAHVEKVAGGPGKDGESTWERAVDLALADNRETTRKEWEKNMIMAQKMQGVIDREQTLFDQEAAEREAKRREAKD